MNPLLDEGRTDGGLNGHGYIDNYHVTSTRDYPNHSLEVAAQIRYDLLKLTFNFSAPLALRVSIWITTYVDLFRNLTNYR